VTACAHCGTAMPTPTGRASRRRYCTDACRKAAWTKRHRDALDDHDIVAAVVADPVVVATAFRDAVPTDGGQHRCPHCRQPLAVISVLVPAAAAHIRTPEVTHA
jgi:MYND finger